MLIRKLSILLVMLTAVFISGCEKEPGQEEPEIITEAKLAFNYLNEVRTNPALYSMEIGIDLSNIAAQSELNWNDTLAIVAVNKAQDMAARNYFEHVDPDGNGINILIHEAGYLLPNAWIEDRSTNYFESLAAGRDTGIESIKGLILDNGFDPPLHRQHLLGEVDFWAECYDIGIGFVETENARYSSYCCIIIAKH